jgi:antitoxin component YwqK of YwqJK toxin-antitoxin module
MQVFNSVSREIISIFPVLLVFLITFSSCIKNVDENISSASQERGLILDETTNKPFTGKVVDTLSSRILEYQVKDGLKNGKFIISFLNGTTEVSGMIKDNKNEGKWSYYYSDGKIESEGFFKNDLPNDKWTWYFPNGNKKEEGDYSKGKREGLWKIYNEDGTIKEEVLFKNGNQLNSDQQKPVIIT